MNQYFYADLGRGAMFAWDFNEITKLNLFISTCSCGRHCSRGAYLLFGLRRHLTTVWEPGDCRSPAFLDLVQDLVAKTLELHGTFMEAK